MITSKEESGPVVDVEECTRGHIASEHEAGTRQTGTREQTFG